MIGHYGKVSQSIEGQNAPALGERSPGILYPPTEETCVRTGHGQD